MRLLHVVDIAQPLHSRGWHWSFQPPTTRSISETRRGLAPSTVAAIAGPTRTSAPSGRGGSGSRPDRPGCETNSTRIWFVLGVNRRGRLARRLHSTTGHALRRLKRPVLVVPVQRETSRVKPPTFSIRSPPDELTSDRSRSHACPPVAPTEQLAANSCRPLSARRCYFVAAVHERRHRISPATRSSGAALPRSRSATAVRTRGRIQRARRRSLRRSGRRAAPVDRR